MNKLSLTADELKIVQSILNQYIPNIPVWAFGSRVKGTARPYSDLDLAIMTETPLSLEKYAELKEAFSESDLVWKVDIIDWATTKESFREIIQQRYVILQ